MGVVPPALNYTPRSIAVRIFLTVWLIYSAHLTSNVVRETYLAISLGDRLSVRVDPFIGLHPDLFEIPGRGSYINGNPGASLLGALPYAMARPLIAGLFALKPELAAPKPPTTYEDPRPNRTKLMNEMRARGLDVRLALAAFATQLGLMAPIGALAAALMFLYVRARFGADDRTATWLALLYAFGTPVFFRSGFLNHNVLVAHSVLGAWMFLTWPGMRDHDRSRPRRWAAVGGLLGFGLLLDYSAAPLAIVFGGWALCEGFASGGMSAAIRRGGAYVVGSIIPVLMLLGYQWLAFESPWFPAQRYMPDTSLSVIGWNGFSVPTFDLFWRNLLDPRYGLFVFCPMLVGLLAAPFVARGGSGSKVRTEGTVAIMAAAALWIFCSANQFTHLQWNTGVRYMVPAVPLLYLVLVPVLLSIRPWMRWTLIAPTLVVSVAVSMTREDPLAAVRMLLTDGPALPMLVVLSKTAAAYAPFMGGGVQPWGFVATVLLGITVAGIWGGLGAVRAR